MYLIIFSLVFLFLAKSLSNYVSHTNYVDPYQDIDSKAYIFNAEKFYKHGKTVLKEADKTVPYFSLGYPVFLATIYKIFSNKNNTVIWMQIILVLLTCFLIFSIANLIWGFSTAIIAFILSCLNVGFITFSNFILTESLLVFLLTSFLYFFVLFLYKNNYRNLVYSGLVLGLSVWVKPAAMYFIFFILILLASLRLESKFKNFKALVLFAISFYAPVISYAVFNKVNYGNFCVTTLAKENLYFYLLPKVLAIKNKTSEKIEQKNMAKLVPGNKLDSKSWDKAGEIFKQTLSKDHFIFIKVWFKNVMKTMFGLYSTNLKVLVNKNLAGGDLSFFKLKGKFFDRISNYVLSGTDLYTVKLVAVLEVIWSLLRIFLILAALIFLLVRRNFKIFFLLIFYIFYFAFITGHDGCARFRMMFEPVLIILVAQGLQMFWYRIRYKSCPLGESYE